MPCSGCAKRKAALLKAGQSVARVVRRVVGKPLPSAVRRPVPPLPPKPPEKAD